MLDKTLEQMMQYLNVNEEAIASIQKNLDDFTNAKITALECIDEISKTMKLRKEKLK